MLCKLRVVLVQTNKTIASSQHSAKYLSSTTCRWDTADTLDQDKLKEPFKQYASKAGDLKHFSQE